MYVFLAALFSGPTGTARQKLCGPGVMGLMPSQLLTLHWAGLMASPSTGGKPNTLIFNDLRYKLLHCSRQGSKTTKQTKISISTLHITISLYCLSKYLLCLRLDL